MARPPKRFDPPKWFDLKRYADASKMDAADWYLSLSLRGHLARKPEPFFYSHLRQTEPLIRRHADSLKNKFIFHGADLPSDFLAMLGDRAPRSGITSLRGDELYVFEKRLPETVREFGRTFVPGETSADEAPEGFSGPVDKLFERRMLGLFARIDLSLPDKVLLQDLSDFLTLKRAELAVIPGPQPYRAALRELRAKKRPNLATWAKLAVLPFIDIEEWRKESGASMSRAKLAELLDIDIDDLRETEKYAHLLMQDMVLRGWMMPFARAAILKSSR